MSTLNMTWKDVQEIGFFEAHSLYDIASEMNARELDALGLMLDKPHASKEYRDEVTGWTRRRQPRSYPEFGKLPKEVEETLRKAFNSGR